MVIFDFSCPHCGTTLEAKDEWRGRVTQCPECKKNITVPLVKKVDYEALEEEYKKKVFWKRLILFCILLIAVSALAGGIIYHKHQAEQRKIQEKRLREEKRLAEEKRRAEERRLREEKRLAEEKRRAEEKQRIKEVITAELERADKCKTPQEAVEILEKLLNNYSQYYDLLPEVKRKRDIFREGVYIKQAVWRAKNSNLYYEKISLLDNVIRRYPLNPYCEEAKKLLLKYKTEQEKYEAEKRAIQRQIAETEQEIREKREKERLKNQERREREWRESQNRQAAAIEQMRCRWCKGTGRRSSVSSKRDCSYCLGHGIKMTEAERQSHRRHCGTYKSTRFGCYRFRR